MTYNLIITERADKMIDNLIYYILHKLYNPPAALHFIENLENIYQRLKENPLQFPKCSNKIFKNKEYRQALFSKMNYRVIFRIDEQTVYIVGVFHTLENYEQKL